MSRGHDAARFLYRCLGVDGRLLYVGMTNDVDRRVETHRRSWWGHHIDRVEATDHGTGPEARAAEREAIATERPRFNRQGRWADRSSWDVEDYRDYYDATYFAPTSGHKARRLETTRAECLNRYGVDIAAPTNKEIA